MQQANKIIALTRANDVIPTDGFTKKIARALIRIIPKSVRKSELLKTVKWFQKNHDDVQDGYVWKSMAAGWHIKKWTFPQGMPDEYGEASFNGRVFPAFKDYKGMLELLYGDYMKLPLSQSKFVSTTHSKSSSAKGWNRAWLDLKNDLNTH